MRTGVVYKITNPKGLVYIGSTMNFNKRVVYYKNTKCMGQRKLYASLLKYGFAAHKIDTIALVNEVDLKKKEREYGIFYNVLDENVGLNSILPGYGDVKALWSRDYKDKHTDRSKLQIAVTRTLEEKKKISLNSKRVKPSDETKEKAREKLSRAILQFDKAGILVCEYKSTVEAVSKTGINRSSIKENLNNRSRSAGGYVWKYKDGIIKGKNHKMVNQLDMSGKIVKIHDSISQAAKSVQVDFTSIRYVLRGKGQTAGGFMWKYANKKGGVLSL